MANNSANIPHPVMFHTDKELHQYDGSVVPQSPEANNNGGYVPITFSDRIFIGSLQPDVGEDQLRSVFSKEGEIKDCKIVREGSNRSKGYGFITFKTQETADKVLNRPPGYYVHKGRPWNVSTAVRRVSSASSPPASAGYYPYVFSPVQANYMYPYGYYVPPGSPYSASSQYSQDGHFIYPPVYPYAYYPGDIYTGQEYQEVTAGGDAPVPEATKAE